MREQPPTPETLGLNTATTEIEVLTEFLNPPAATRKEHVRKNQLPDQDISWGVARLGHGQAFDLADPPNRPSHVQVRRQYETVNGRTILIEAIPLPDIQPHLQTLPQQASTSPRTVPVPGHSNLQSDATPGTPQPTSASGPTPVGPPATSGSPGVSSHPPQPNTPKVGQASSLTVSPPPNSSFIIHNFPLPPTPPAKSQPQPMKLAAAAPAASGFVLDYVELNSDPADFTFQSDTTYLITDGVNYGDTATFEGGTVIKFSDALDPDTYYYDPAGWYGYGALAVNNVIFQAGAYRPVLFTSMDDDSVGEVIPGSSGSPAPGNIVYFSTPNAYSGQINNCRFSYAYVALMVYNFNQLLLTDCQFVNNTIGVGGWGNVLTVENGLFSGPIGIRDPEGDQFNFQNVTMDNRLYNFDIPQTDAAMDVNFDGSWTSYALTNCLFSGSPYTYEQVVAAIINDGGTAAAASSYDVNDAPGGDFQTAGAGNYYLAAGSPYHNAGTPNIDPNLLADLATKTTYPPAVYDNDASTFTGNNTFTPAAVPRDNTGNPDVGYHYDPIDVLVGGSDLSANLTLTAGTVLAWFDDYGVGNLYTCGQPYGLSLNDGATLTATGTATAPCWLTRYNTVQEGALGSRGWLGGLLLNGSGNTPLPQITAQFAEFSTVNSVGNVLRDFYAAGVAGFTDCEFYYGVCSYWPSYYFTNCLFVRAGLSFNSCVDASSFTFQNCTFWQQALYFYRFAGQSPSQWTILNTTFDGTTISTYDELNGDPGSTTLDYNAFGDGANRLEIHGPHDVLANSGFNWQPSWLGNYYLPANSPLIQKGHPTADLWA